MAISTPQRYLSDGLVWRITGSPYTRRTRITLLLQGRYAACLRENRELHRGAIATAAGALRVNAPVDTGMLRASVRNEGEAVTLGPEPYDRTLLKARLAGRATVRRRRRGRPRLSKYYALPANARSGRQEYIERSLDIASKPIIEVCRSYESVRDSEARLEDALLGVGTPSEAQVEAAFQRGRRPAPRLRIRR